MTRISAACSSLVALLALVGCAPSSLSGTHRDCESAGSCPGADGPADGFYGGDDAGWPDDRADDPGAPGYGAEELCGNGRDDDGDGEADEQCACAPGDTQGCFGGPPAAAGIGVCTLGEQACDAMGEFGSWGACTGWVEPTEELCDGLDNDCDGTADEGCGCGEGETRSCYTGPTGTEGVGACAAGTQVCSAGAWGPCDGSTLPEADTCDGIDNDCDGTADADCGCTIGTSRSCYETPSGTPGTGNPGVGSCAEGRSTCEPLHGGGSGFGPCIGATTAAAEICMTGQDEDCDGLVDEECGVPTVDCTVADVLFLMDTTGSMAGEIAQIQARIRDTIVPGLDREIDDVRFSVARFDDFAAGTYGSAGDLPFQMVQTSTADVATTQAAVNSLRAGGGADAPESHVEALYQTATGAGLVPWVGPRSGCAPGTVGYPCFRTGATPIILLFTDAPFHNGPGGSYPYAGLGSSPHSYAQAVTALNDIGAKVLGLMSGAAAAGDLNRIARDTGAVAADGSPIVFDIGASGVSLGANVLRAVQTLCR